MHGEWRMEDADWSFSRCVLIGSYAHIRCECSVLLTVLLDACGPVRAALLTPSAPWFLSKILDFGGTCCRRKVRTYGDE